MEQIAITFEPRRARRDDVGTSQEAASRVREFDGEHYRLILEALAVGCGTIYTIAARTRLSHVQIARRLPELEQAGKVRAEGVAPGPTGRSCRLWWIA